MSRTVKMTTKWVFQSVARRFKILQPAMADELDIELWILDWLEKQCYSVLATLGVPTSLWDYYVGFCKQIWERSMKFTDETYLLEKTSLLNEYVARGLDIVVLEAVQPVGELAASFKVAGAIGPVPPAWAYFDLIGSVWLQEQGGYTWTTGGAGIYVEIPQGWGGGYFNRQ